MPVHAAEPPGGKRGRRLQVKTIQSEKKANIRKSWRVQADKEMRLETRTILILVLITVMLYVGTKQVCHLKAYHTLVLIYRGHNAMVTCDVARL